MNRIELLLLSISLSLVGIGVLFIWGIFVAYYSYRAEFLLLIGVVILLMALLIALTTFSRKNK